MNFWQGTGISFKVNIDLTWSKIMALAVLIAAVYIETILEESNGMVFLTSLSSVTLLILNKQWVNKKDDNLINKK